MAITAKVATAYVDLVMRTEAFEKATGDARAITRKFGAEMKAETREARGSMALLGEEIGVHIPCHLQTFIAQLPGVSRAMSAAFDTVAVVAMAGVIFEAGKKVMEFASKNEEAARKNVEAWSKQSSEIEKSTLDLVAQTDKINDEIAKLEHKPKNGLKDALDEARKSAFDLDEQLRKSIEDSMKLLRSQNVGLFHQAVTGAAGNGSAQAILESISDREKIENDNYSQALNGGKFKTKEEAEKAEQEHYRRLRNITSGGWNQMNTELRGRVTLRDQQKAGRGMTDDRHALELKYGSGSQDVAISGLQQAMSPLGQMGWNLNAQAQNFSANTRLAQDQAKAIIDKSRAAGKPVDKQAKEFGDMVMQMVKDNDFATAENQKIVDAITATDERLLKDRQTFNEDLNHTGERWRRYNAEVERGTIEQIKLDNALQLTNMHLQLSKGFLSPHAAALVEAGAHAKEYAAELAEINSEIDHTQVDSSLTPVQRATQVQDLQGQVQKIQSQAQLQRIIDAQEVLSTTWSGMIDGVFDELRRKAQDTQQDIQRIAVQTIDGLNSEFAKAVTGKKTNFSGVLDNASQSLAKKGIEGAEGFLLGTHKKADGYHVYVDNLPGMAGGKSGGLIPTMFWGDQKKGDPKNGKEYSASYDELFHPKGSSGSGVGSELFTQVGGASKGLLGMLNDSNFFSSLFGGLLFGAGSIFGHFASGGDVLGGVPVEVGELGPERFTPSVPGRITPNKSMGGSGAYYDITVNGGDPELNKANFQQALARVHSSATQTAIAVQRERQARQPRSRSKF